MPDRISRRRFVAGTASAVAGVGLSGCGTVLHPERRGQPAGRLDWTIVALDAVGLLLFFVPGVIAFAVDFNNGTIYLPPDRYGRSPQPGIQPQLESFEIPRRDLTTTGLERIVSELTGTDVRLVQGEYRTERLDHLDDFWTTRDRLNAA